MLLPQAFSWDGPHIALTLPGGEVRFTTRPRGEQDDVHATLDLRFWDDTGDPHRHLAALGAVAGVAAERLAMSHQVHGHRVRRIADPAELRDPPGDYDGQATALQGVACAVRVADCLPIALVSTGAVAMIHAGWRGLADGVVEEGVRAMRELGGRAKIRAAIGPGAGVCCYEAGDEVHAAFVHHGPLARHGPRADLKAIARSILSDWAVNEVHDVGICTMCAEPGLLWSHRREGAAAGRQVGITWRS